MMNTVRLHALTSAHVDTLKSALRLAIRTEKQTLSYERQYMPPGAIQNVEARIRAMEALADGLSPSVPPSLPHDTSTPAAGLTTCDDRR